MMLHGTIIGITLCISVYFSGHTPSAGIFLPVKSHDMSVFLCNYSCHVILNMDEYVSGAAAIFGWIKIGRGPHWAVMVEVLIELAVNK